MRNYSYKSLYNVETLYPLSKPIGSQVPEISNFHGCHKLKLFRLIITTVSGDKFVGEIPPEKLNYSFSRSSGPGGQHVNKTYSRVTAKFNVMDADWLPVNTRSQIYEKFKKRITKKGELIVSSGKSRHQLQNRKDCIDQIKEIIMLAQKEPDRTKEQEIAKLHNVASIEKASKNRLRRKRMDSYTKNMRKCFDD